ncbi:MAG: hypothetical protein JWO92_1206 [Chitinophagaceae bacterium]|nr:hypothetical protein [Chitinophagaceae bacterium]
MDQNINFKYLNAQLKIGVMDLKNVYLLLPIANAFSGITRSLSHLLIKEFPIGPKFNAA